MRLYQMNAFSEPDPVDVPMKAKKSKNITYEEFVEKFKPKKTTDDCYTPPAVYEAVLGWVKGRLDIEGKNVVRPFYPGGDYENYPYGPGDVVVDNPPFSIVSNICRFYNDRGIPYFLFAPHLTLFSPMVRHTAIVVGATVTYENGAVVSTSFLSNMFGDVAAMTAPGLRLAIKEAQSFAKNEKPALPKYVYPDEVITVSRLEAMTKGGEEYRVMWNECEKIVALDSQRPHKKTIFWKGLLVSRRKAEEARRKAEEARRKAEEARWKAEEARRETVVWAISDRELSIIQSLK